MNVSKEALFNVDDAKALSFYLTGTKALADEQSESAYIQFSSGIQFGQSVSRAETKVQSAPKEPELKVPDKPFDSWDAMLDWCKGITKAKAYFVVDPQGFILLREGDETTDDGFEGAGANLQLAIDQLRQMQLDEDEVQVMDLVYRDKGMLVFRAKDKENDFFTLCFIAPAKVSDSQKDAMFQQIQRSVIQLT